MAFLITQSLVSAWAYLFDCAEGQEDVARAEFERTLHRETGERTEAMQAGIDFENAVYADAAGLPYSAPMWENGIKKVSDFIQGAQVQVKLSRPIEVDGEEYLVYGVLDALRAGIIYDVKFTSAKGGLGGRDFYGKYLDSPQHPFYFYLVPEARAFCYLLSDGEDVYVEPYFPNECRSAESIIRTFIHSIAEMGYLNLYREKWVAK
ncbi:hypothetical protein D1159_03650 [Pseudoflavonifractor sp. 524-17]|uniref:hypothetical protein n=1 Tax=Pseudoflavonifractor sp. 524-17 TaxID=2304577 RepID=UPI00137946CB|nr:hypothetical protein [Pseudoflavonifractor sp. 524-17]NCE63694.1 hypothetical protein [Pseudoflavonifractor sp. 524-17]